MNVKLKALARPCEGLKEGNKGHRPPETSPAGDSSATWGECTRTFTQDLRQGQKAKSMLCIVLVMR